MRDLLITLIVLTSVPMTFVRPFIGILVFYWLSLMNPHRLTWGFAQTMRVALISGIAVILAWLISREPKRPPGSAPVLLLGAFAVWLTVCSFFAVNPADGWTKWVLVIKILVMTFVGMCLLQERNRLHLLTWVIVVSIGVYGVRGGLFTILTGGNYRVFGPPDSFIADNNQLALALIMVLPLMWYLQDQAEHRFVRFGLWGAAGLTLIAVIGTYSRGGFLALCVMLLFLLWKSKNRLLIAVLAGGLMAGVLAYQPDRWFNRMQTIGSYEVDQSALGRFQAWEFAMKVAMERPIFGGGFRVFYDRDYFYRLVPDAMTSRNAHSIYFEVLGETGFIGLALFLALGLSCLLACGRIIRRTHGREDLAWARTLAAMIQVSLIGYAVAGAFLNLGFFDLYYIIIVLIVGLRVCVDRELARNTTSEDMPAYDRLVPVRSSAV